MAQLPQLLGAAGAGASQLVSGPLGIAIGVGSTLLGGLFGGGPSQAELAAFNAEVNRQSQERARAESRTQQANALLARAEEGRIGAIGRIGAGQQSALQNLVTGFRSTLL